MIGWQSRGKGELGIAGENERAGRVECDLQEGEMVMSL